MVNRAENCENMSRAFQRTSLEGSAHVAFFSHWQNPVSGLKKTGEKGMAKGIKALNRLSVKWLECFFRKKFVSVWRRL